MRSTTNHRPTNPSTFAITADAMVNSLGGVAVTPELERLKSQGIWFVQFDATGTRSVRGIEAVAIGPQSTPLQ